MAPWQPGPPVTWRGGPGVAGLGCGKETGWGLWRGAAGGWGARGAGDAGLALSRAVGRAPGGRRGGYLALTSSPPLPHRHRRRWRRLSRGGLAGREPAPGARTGCPWGGAGRRGCRHHRLAALRPPSSGRFGAPFPSWGSLPAAGAGVGRGAVPAPLCRSLAAAPLRGLPGCLSSQLDPALIQGVCKKLGSYKFGLCRRENGYGAGIAGGFLSDWQLRGRGAQHQLGHAACSSRLPPALLDASKDLSAAQPFCLA